MKYKRGTRRAHLHCVGPSLLIKAVNKEDSFIRFATQCETNWQWEKRLIEYRTDALFREDPFGATEFNVPYSMDKKRRWIVLEVLGDEIERHQDPDRSLRISASIHIGSTNSGLTNMHRWGWRYVDTIQTLPTAEYHDVLRDRRVRHRVHRHAHLNTIDRDANKKGANESTPQSLLKYDEDLRYQKAHVRYNVVAMVHDKRPVHAYNHPKFKYDVNAPKRDRGCERRELILQDIQLDLPCDIGENELFGVDCDIKDVQARVERTLLDCVIQKNPSMRKRKRTVKLKFVDEACRAKFEFPEQDSVYEEEFEIITLPKYRLTVNKNLPYKDVAGSCSICNGAFSGSAFSLDCGHFFCTACWMRHAQNCLDSGCDAVPCMDPHCNDTLSIKNATALLSPESLDLYRPIVQESRIRMGKARRCQHCRWVVNYSEQATDSCSCGVLLCGHCPYLFHGQFPCDKAAQYNCYLKSKGLFYDNSASNVVTDLVRCPACHIPIQREKGCDRIVCVCGTHFCFTCGRELNVEHFGDGVCIQKEMEVIVVLDVFTRINMSTFSRKLLTKAVRRRVELFLRRDEIAKDLISLSQSKARMCMRKIEAAYLLLEFTILRNSDTRAVGGMELALSKFLNTTSGSRGNCQTAMLARAEEMSTDCIKLANIAQLTYQLRN